MRPKKSTHLILVEKYAKNTQSSEKYSRKWGKVLVENSPGKFGKIWTTFLFSMMLPKSSYVGLFFSRAISTVRTDDKDGTKTFPDLKSEEK